MKLFKKFLSIAGIALFLVGATMPQVKAEVNPIVEEVPDGHSLCVRPSVHEYLRRDNWGNNLLHIAVMGNDFATLERFVNDFMANLHLTIDDNSIIMTAFLAKNKLGETPWDTAIRMGNQEIIELLGQAVHAGARERKRPTSHTSHTSYTSHTSHTRAGTHEIYEIDEIYLHYHSHYI